MTGEARGAIYLAALIVIWGGNYTWVKLALADIGPLTFNTARYALAAALMAMVLGTKGGIARLLPAPGERAPLAMIGLLQIAVTTACTALALERIEATRVALIIYSMPIWSLAFGSLLYGERASPRTVSGVALGAAGLALLTNPLAMDWSRGATSGLFLAFASVLGWALGAVLYRARAWRSDLWSQTFWQIAVSVAALAPITAAFERDAPIDATPTLVALLLYNAIAPSVIGYWCWAQALARLPVTQASQFLLLSPVYGIAQNHLVLGEPLTAGVFLACAFIVAGAFLSLSGRRR